MILLQNIPQITIPIIYRHFEFLSYYFKHIIKRGESYELNIFFSNYSLIVPSFLLKLVAAKRILF